jgi:hypothetical protein
MENQAEKVSSILVEWESIKSRLVPLFRNRDQKNAKEWMEKGIALYIQFLYCTNGVTYFPATQVPFDQFHFKPVNIAERLRFIISSPALYHSFRQLSEIMIEQEKQYVKSKIVKKTSRPKA